MELGKRVKIAYGIIGIADQCQYFLFGTFFLFFATTVAGLDAAVAGAMAAITLLRRLSGLRPLTGARSGPAPVSAQRPFGPFWPLKMGPHPT